MEHDLTAREFVTNVYFTLKHIAQSEYVDEHVNMAREVLGMEPKACSIDCEHKYETVYKETLYKRLILCDKIVKLPYANVCTKCGDTRRING